MRYRPGGEAAGMNALKLKGWPVPAVPKQDSWVTWTTYRWARFQRLRAAQAAGVRSASF